MTVFLSSHVLPEVEQLCDRVAILQKGRIIAEGETQAMLRQGERLFVRFDTAEEVQRARPILEAFGPVEPATTSGALLVEVAEARGSEVIRRLGQEELYPAELSVRRQSLEHVFIELTSEHDPARRRRDREARGRRRGERGVTGLARAEWLRFRKRGSLQLIVLAVPLLVGFFFVAGFASIGETPPPFDAQATRERLISEGVVTGLPPEEAEQLLASLIEGEQLANEQTRAQHAPSARPMPSPRAS